MEANHSSTSASIEQQSLSLRQQQGDAAGLITIHLDVQPSDRVALLSYIEAALRIAAMVGMTFSIGGPSAHPTTRLAESETNPKILDALEYIKRNQGKKGSEIAKAINVPEASFRKWYVPKLRSFGVHNIPGHGYHWSPSSRI